MNIAFFVNSIEDEDPGFSTTRLAAAAAGAGHQVWYLDVEGVSYQPNDHLCSTARRAPAGKPRSREKFLEKVIEADGERLPLEDLEALMLRNDPADDFLERPWAQPMGAIFGEMAADRGVLVLNDPRALARALNKLYFQDFPTECRPRTLISRDREDLKAFVRDQGMAVLKPLQGSGGKGVFLVSKDEDSNVNQMIDAILRDGYVVAQEYLSAAEDGDTRILLMNGAPLQVDGEYAAFRRLRSEGDMRSNIKAGGKPEKADVDETILGICEAVRPKLARDGMFLVGLDIVGDKLMEVNVFSPAGLGVEELLGVDFAPAIIESIEHKVEHAKSHPRLSNSELAVL